MGLWNCSQSRSRTNRATASFADGIKTKDGDVFEITAEPFRYGLRNALETAKDETVTIHAL